MEEAIVTEEVIEAEAAPVPRVKEEPDSVVKQALVIEEVTET